MLIAARTGVWSGGVKLPYKRRLAWISSSGQQYLDFGIKCTSTLTLKARVSSVAIKGESGRDRILSWYVYSGTYIGVACNTYNAGHEWGISNGTAVTLTVDNKEICDLEITPTSKRLNDFIVYENRNTQAGSVFSTLRAFQANGNVFSGKNRRLHEFSLFDNGDEIMKCYPVIDNDDVPCFFDEVSGECFYNKGTGDFLYGELGTTLDGGGYKCVRRFSSRFSRRSTRLLRNPTEWRVAA